MDIDTPQKNFNPAPSIHLHQPTPQKAQPSPFYGRLPPAPLSQARKLRNPPPQHTELAPMRETFFSDKKYRQRTPSVSTTITQLSDGPDSPRRMEMATPKFFAKSSNDEATGLETHFGPNFSLGDEPPELRGTRSTKTVLPVDLRLVSNLIVLLFSCAVWSYAPQDYRHTYHLRLVTLCIASVVSGLHLISSLRFDLPFWIVSDILVYTLGLVSAIGLGYKLRQASLQDEDLAESISNFPIYYFFTLVIVEAIVLYEDFKLRRTMPKRTSPLATRRSAPLQNQEEPTVDPMAMFLPKSARPVAVPTSRGATPTPNPPRSLISSRQQESQTSAPVLRSSMKPKRESMGLGGLSLDSPPNRGTGSNTWNTANTSTRVLRNRANNPWDRGTL